jgi:DNA-binding MarR family transcriptional regulator
VDIPTRDTPAHALLARGLGGDDTDAAAVVDCMQLLRVSKHLLGYFLDRFTDRGISPGKYSVLCELLAAEDSVSPSWIAERIGVSRPTVTGLLDGLCRQGFVARQFDEQDRRRVTIRLTGAGEAFIRNLLPEQYRLMTDVVDALEPEERTQLRALLKKLEDRLA